MRGKTADEARAELEKQGLSGEALEALVPHKVFQRQPADQLDPAADKLTPRTPRHADRALRAQDLHPGHDLEHQLLRPVGRRAGQAARQGDPARARAGRRGPVTMLHERADQVIRGQEQ